MKRPSEKSTEVRQDLTGSNHAFYVGKFIPRTFREKLTTLVTGKEKSRIYSEEFYLMMLDEAFKRVKDGERPKVVMAPQLSEIFNGEADIKHALNVAEQRKLIQKLAKSRFGREDVEVETVEDQPLHQPFFAELRAAINPETHELDIEKALGAEELSDFSESPDSLEIARHLYAATKESDTLFKIFKHAVPGRLKEGEENESKDEEGEEERLPKHYYAMAEVAIRLADILHGVQIHGGAGRQNKYDEIIEKIIKGKKGGYKRIPQLQQLFDLMEGRLFETIHLNTASNFYAERRSATIKTLRLALGSMLGMAALGTAFSQGVRYQEAKQARIDEMVKGSMQERLKNETFYWDGKFAVSKDRNVNVFIKIVKECQKDLVDRYRFSEADVMTLRPLLQEYLLEHEHPSMMDDNAFPRMDAVDRFVKMHRMFLQSMGLEPERPYADLMPQLEVFEQAADSPDDGYRFSYVHRESSAEKQWGATGKEDSDIPKELIRVGEFVSGESMYNHYAFYFHESNGARRLVARDSREERGANRIYSSRRAREGALQFLYAIQRFDTLDLGRNHQELYELKNWNDFETRGNFISPCTHKAREDINRDIMPPIGVYQDSRGQFTYEFLIERAYDDEKNSTFNCLLAKKSGENEFTYQRAQEMAERYEAVQDRWFDFYSGKYYEPMIPLNTKLILQEVEDSRMLAIQWRMILGEKKLPYDILTDLEAMAGVYPDMFQEMADQYDGSYKSTRRIMETLEGARKSREKVEWYIKRECHGLLME